MKSGVPVVLSDRSVTSDNYLSLVNADDWSLGRHMAQWIADAQAEHEELEELDVEF